MSRRRFTQVCLIAFLAMMLVAPIGSASEASESPPDLTTFTHDLDEHVIAAMNTYGIPGVVIALVEDGVLVWSGAYGYADLETSRPMTVGAVNRTESISKSVSAWGVMKLVERGEIGLDDPVVEYFDDWFFPGATYLPGNITVRQLLTHTAGLAPGSIGVHYPPEGDVPSLEENLSRETHLDRTPGSSFVYSNVGFNLLELLIEEVTGQDFAMYMDREVLAPLGMQHSSFEWNSETAESLPTGYDLDGNPVPAYVYPEKASGGLFSTVEDVARFVSAGMVDSDAGDREGLKPESVRRLYEPAVEIPGLFGFVADSYGLGHFVENLSNGKQAVWHGGQGHGWMTHFHSVPESGDGIVILTNSQRSWPLIAGILSDWSEWIGFSPVGMSIISAATTGLWTVIGLAWLWAVWQLWRVGRSIYSGRRGVAPTSTQNLFRRLVQAALALILVSSLIWAISQDYLFVSSIFPQAAGWLGLTILAVAVVLVISAAAPQCDDAAAPLTTASSRNDGQSLHGGGGG